MEDLDWKRVVKHSGGEKGQKSVGKIRAAAPSPRRHLISRLAGRLPKKFEAELDLAGGAGGAGDDAGGGGDAGRGEDDGVGLVEIRAIEKVENFGAKLKIQALTNSRVFEHGEIPGCQAGPDQGVSPYVSVEPAV